MKSVALVFIVGFISGYMIAGIESAHVSVTTPPGIGSEQNAVHSNDGLQTPSEKPVIQSLIDEKIGLQFLYRTYPDSYVLSQFIKTPHDDVTFVKGYRLMLLTDKEELDHSTAPREGPPTISVLVFKNDEKLAPKVWALQFPTISNISLTHAAPLNTTLSRADAIRYTVDGLYEGDTVIATSGRYIYVFSGMYTDEQSPIRADFISFLSSVEFLPIQ